jgi:hypothetical protein
MMPIVSMTTAVPKSDPVSTIPIWDGIVTDDGQVGRQDDRRKAIGEAADAADAAGQIQQADV